MWHRSGCLACVCSAFVMSLTCGVAADVFVEITYAGQQPDGLWDSIPFGGQGTFDIWMWGTGPDTELKAFVMVVGGTPAAHNTEWTALSVGQVDPHNYFTNSLIEDNGELNTGLLDGIAIIPSLPNEPGVPFDSLANAKRIYAGFDAVNIAAGGELTAALALIHTNVATGRPVTVIGVVETPAPGTAGLLGCTGLLALRRRR
ncbi:MAG: hypothetical protein H6815_01565 [Phycisphaeraceae bacterium]|nr:hypothetical protein [Phycisphaerales bacterium]MCB9859115.1 hypothetical protein [Phycisphaeraceae bacterium]